MKIYIPVPVSERLPNLEGHYIVTNESKEIRIRYYEDGKFKLIQSEYPITHWLEEREFKNEQEIATMMITYFLKYLSDEQKKSVINSMIQRTDILPSEEEIIKESKDFSAYAMERFGFEEGANFIINKITGK